MKMFLKLLFALLLPFTVAVTAVAQDYKEGSNYLRLSKPQPTSTTDKIEVVELFWYGCPHCYDLEPHIEKWLENKPEDVEFVRLPAIVGPRWEPLAQAYYTAEVLGVLDKTHAAMFDAIHKQKQKFTNEEQIKEFFVAHDVSDTDFKNAYHSFAVSVKMNNAKLMTRRYAITGVPTLIVNGKFSTSGKLAGSETGILKVVDYLIEQERTTGTPLAPAALK
ncbi:MAG: thiol:disulfide interchange protein DsbA/DsbL [Gammaproteobacteria bacterium]|nr:MAG: thiol:disulfide interchange protein DsbA/DsbL [Gammaproteobacteria bacterium]